MNEQVAIAEPSESELRGPGQTTVLFGHNWKSKVKAALGRDDEMGPADNIARERYNAMIREKYGATGRLVDIAAAELLKMVATNSPVA